MLLFQEYSLKPAPTRGAARRGAARRGAEERQRLLRRSLRILHRGIIFLKSIYRLEVNDRTGARGVALSLRRLLVPVSFRHGMPTSATPGAPGGA